LEKVIGLLEVLAEPSGLVRFPLDIMHDFLSYLSQEMSELHIRKRQEMRRFLTSLERALKIQADKKDAVGIESLKGKTTLKNYSGNYQTNDSEVPFEALWEVLQKNSRRLTSSLNADFKEQTRQGYANSIAMVRPLKTKLSFTDHLIDQLVYRLYGLTEEGIAIVEAKLR
jgi:hypothetical protein